MTVLFLLSINIHSIRAFIEIGGHAIRTFRQLHRRAYDYNMHSILQYTIKSEINVEKIFIVELCFQMICGSFLRNASSTSRVIWGHLQFSIRSGSFYCSHSAIFGHLSHSSKSLCPLRWTMLACSSPSRDSSSIKTLLPILIGLPLRPRLIFCTSVRNGNHHSLLGSLSLSYFLLLSLSLSNLSHAG